MPGDMKNVAAFFVRSETLQRLPSYAVLRDHNLGRTAIGLDPADRRLERSALSPGRQRRVLRWDAEDRQDARHAPFLRLEAAPRAGQLVDARDVAACGDRRLPALTTRRDASREP
jgi:hypothetical protein